MTLVAYTFVWTNEQFVSFNFLPTMKFHGSIQCRTASFRVANNSEVKLLFFENEYYANAQSRVTLMYVCTCTCIRLVSLDEDTRTLCMVPATCLGKSTNLSLKWGCPPLIRTILKFSQWCRNCVRGFWNLQTCISAYINAHVFICTFNCV